MSSSAIKSPMKDPARVPTVEDVDRQLGPFSRYARTVRGAARVSGLSARLSWTNSGWVEHLRQEELLVGVINLAKVPPVAEIGVSKALEEALAPRLTSEVLKKALADAEGVNVKWVEIEVNGPENAEAAAALVTLKTELLSSGIVSPSLAERTKAPLRPGMPHEPKVAPVAANRNPAETRSKAPKRHAKVAAKPKVAARTATKRPAKPPKKAKPAIKAKPKAKAKRGR